MHFCTFKGMLSSLFFLWVLSVQDFFPTTTYNCRGIGNPILNCTLILSILETLDIKLVLVVDFKLYSLQGRYTSRSLLFGVHIGNTCGVELMLYPRGLVEVKTLYSSQYMDIQIRHCCCDSGLSCEHRTTPDIIISNLTISNSFQIHCIGRLREIVKTT